jgi:hypothetical protein
MRLKRAAPSLIRPLVMPPAQAPTTAAGRTIGGFILRGLTPAQAEIERISVIEGRFLNEGLIVAMDTPRNLKLQHGQRSVRMEYSLNGGAQTAVLLLDHPADQVELNRLIATGRIQTMHSQEATLEQIFMKMTGRGLS